MLQNNKDKIEQNMAKFINSLKTGAPFMVASQDVSNASAQYGTVAVTGSFPMGIPAKTIVCEEDVVYEEICAQQTFYCMISAYNDTQQLSCIDLLNGVRLHFRTSASHEFFSLLNVAIVNCGKVKDVDVKVKQELQQRAFFEVKLTALNVLRVEVQEATSFPVEINGKASTIDK